MAKRNNKAVVAVIDNLTTNQLALIQKDVVVAKNKYASGARGTFVTFDTKKIGNYLQKEIKKIGGKRG